LAFIPVFVAIDPIGLIAIFYGTSDKRNRRRTGNIKLSSESSLPFALRSIIFSRQNYFRRARITVADFQVAGD